MDDVEPPSANPAASETETIQGGRRPPAGPGDARRPRRYDPDRRNRILDAALDVVAEYGLAGTTHRHIAVRADVPLGSVTYHFSSLADLQAQAFARHVELQAAKSEDLFKEVETPEQFIEVLVDLVHGGPARHRSAVLGFELHLAALRNPELRVLTREWTRASRAVLARFTSQDTAIHLDALLEGMIMHALLAAGPETREATRAAIVQVLGLVGGTA
jgi:DNA-binding transcriptional regulator YbjK